jgi:glycerol kinase
LQFSSPVDQLQPAEIACLLLEAIIFRVVRILEEFNHEAALKRVYLSGGLSELSSLQQGITQCLTFDGLACDVYRLQQRDASLQGAAMLAGGMSYVVHKDAEKLGSTSVNRALPEKYRRWKLWFDEMLKT